MVKSKIFEKWIFISVFNFLIVAFLGVLMRYKIGFEFPYFDQKNLQHAHSHFAFSGWVSQLLIVLMVSSIHKYLPDSKIKSYQNIFLVNLLTAFGMLVSFSIQGYAFFSILFSTCSLLITFLFIAMFTRDIKLLENFIAKRWYVSALLFYLLSALGTFSLIYMMANHKIPQHTYLASIYWYLHFQYNGWFFFALMGLFFNYLQSHYPAIGSSNRVFNLLFFSCLPAYGLSVLWLELPNWVYFIVVIAAVAQCFGWFEFLHLLKKTSFFYNSNLSKMVKFLLLFSLIAFTIKFTLQLGSVIPSISKLAFGFRPIVIAYLHLVLLASVSVFLLVFVFLSGVVKTSKISSVAVLVLVFGIFLNELTLAVQGIASFSYIMVPKINTILFSIACLMYLGLLIFFVEQCRLHFLKAKTSAVLPKG